MSSPRSVKPPIEPSSLASGAGRVTVTAAPTVHAFASSVRVAVGVVIAGEAGDVAVVDGIAALAELGGAEEPEGVVGPPQDATNHAMVVRAASRRFTSPFPAVRLGAASADWHGRTVCRSDRPAAGEETSSERTQQVR